MEFRYLERWEGEISYVSIVLGCISGGINNVVWPMGNQDAAATTEKFHPQVRCRVLALPVGLPVLAWVLHIMA